MGIHDDGHLVLDALGSCMPSVPSAAARPWMELLEGTLTKARRGVDALRHDLQGALSVPDVEEAGAQLGFLQVACFSLARTRLCSSALKSLARAQGVIKRAFNPEH